jgi:hypothetical protein
MLQLKFAEVKTPCFIGGKNHGLKLDPTRSGGLELVYDRQEKELHATFNGETVIIPSGDIARMVEGVPTLRAPQVSHPMTAGIISAQVETPMSHVHAGHGHGKSGVGGKVK